jgi:hypothetical protein
VSSISDESVREALRNHTERRAVKRRAFWVTF